MTARFTQRLLQPPLHAKRGNNLKVLGVARISTENQDERSLGDQHVLYQEFLSANTEMPFQLDMLSGKGSGECLERLEYLQAWEKVETGQYDLVIIENLARVARRVHAIQFCKHCEDHNTRVIAIN